MNTSLATVIALIPRSDEQLAHDIGISSKTIKRIKKGVYKPSTRIYNLIFDYINNLGIIIKDFTINKHKHDN